MVERVEAVVVVEFVDVVKVLLRRLTKRWVANTRVALDAPVDAVRLLCFDFVSFV